LISVKGPFYHKKFYIPNLISININISTNANANADIISCREAQGQLGLGNAG
jgi:hypothetical protein